MRNNATCHPERLVKANGLCNRCYMRQWHAAHPDAARRYNRRYLYKVSDEFCEALYFFQKKCCALCKRPDTNGSLHVDHCHSTGVVRGLLCLACNTALGYYEKHLHRFQDFEAYILSAKNLGTELNSLDVEARDAS